MSTCTSRKSIRAALSALLAFGLTAFAVTASAVTLDQIKERGYARVAIANEIPYGYMGLGGVAKGAGPDVAEAVLNKLGVEDIQWVVTSFSSLIPAVKAGRVDLVAAEMAILPDRCKAVDYSVPNSTYGEGLLVPTGNPKDIHSYGEFAKRENLEVAIMAGADQLAMLQALGVPMDRIVMIQTNADAISAVASGRADAYAATGLTAANLAKKSKKVEAVQQFKTPVVHGEKVRSWGGFVFDESSDQFRKKFNQALKQYKQTDEWAQTLRSYGFSQTDIEASFKRSTEQLCHGVE